MISDSGCRVFAQRRGAARKSKVVVTDLVWGPIEAMACGIHLVVWDYAGPRETVLEGVTGLRGMLYDVEVFAQKVLVLLTYCKLNSRLGEAARNMEMAKTYDIGSRLESA